MQPFQLHRRRLHRNHSQVYTFLPWLLLLLGSILWGVFVYTGEIAHGAYAQSEDATCAQPLPTVVWIGEGAGRYPLPAGFDTFVVKRFSPFRFETVSGELSDEGQLVYQATRRERVWACQGDCAFSAYYLESHAFGTLDAGWQIDLVVIDDDGPEQENDLRINWWAADDPLVPHTQVMEQALVEYVHFDVPYAAEWYFYAADSIGMIGVACQPPATPTLTLTPTPTATPTPVPTLTMTSTPTDTATPPLTATATSTPELTMTTTPKLTVLPTEGTPSPTPTIKPPTAITLHYFVAESAAPIANEPAISLRWATALELDVAGFRLWRSATDSRTDAVQITTALIPAMGNASTGAEYRFDDSDVVLGVTYTYWLESVRGDGTVEDVYVRTGYLVDSVYLPFIRN